jgi:hypothetical protein
MNILIFFLFHLIRSFLFFSLWQLLFPPLLHSVYVSFVLFCSFSLANSLLSTFALISFNEFLFVLRKINFHFHCIYCKTLAQTAREWTYVLLKLLNSQKFFRNEIVFFF